MNPNEVMVAVIFFIAFVVGVLLPWSANLTGVNDVELSEIRQEFHHCEKYLEPDLLKANAWQRILFRWGIVGMFNGGILSGFLQRPGWQWLWAVLLEIAALCLLEVYNRRLYGRNLERCRAMLYSSPRLRDRERNVLA